MTTAAMSPRAISHQCWEYERPVPGGIVAGVDGSRQSIAALNTAAAIARTRRCPLHIVTVIPLFPSYQISPGSDERRRGVDQLRVSIKDSELREIVNLLEPRDDWTQEVILGRPARALTSVAERRGADMIIIGCREHGLMDRMLGDETTLQVMRMSAVPVLGVKADLDRPRTAVVAIDFSPGSNRAVSIALDLLGNTGKLYLAYVEPPLDLFPNGFTLPGDGRFPGDIETLFRRLMESLKAHPGVIIETVVLNGKPVSAIAEFADRAGADLIAAGSHGHGRMERFLLGSVSTGLVREARCAVLVVPPGN